jgi:sensor histidine kinase YesM
MGIGLRNIEQRLALLYGERASLNVAHDGARFNVRVALPMERAA